MREMGTNYHRTQGMMSKEAPIGINQNYFIFQFLLFFLKKDCEIASNGMIKVFRKKVGSKSTFR